MSATLREQDRRAVDLLLDRGHQAANGNGNGGTVYAMTDPSLAERVTCVQKLLQVLDLMPTEEPAGDLVSRTLRFVGEAVPATMGVPSLIDAERPVV